MLEIELITPVHWIHERLLESESGDHHHLGMKNDRYHEM